MYVEILSTWEVWRALKRLELLSAAPRATLTPLSCSPNFPRAQYLDIRTLKHELIVNLYIQSKDEESLVKEAFLMSFDLHCNGKNSRFHSHLMNISEYFKLLDFNPDLLHIAMIKSYVSSMKQEYISYW